MLLKAGNLKENTEEFDFIFLLLLFNLNLLLCLTKNTFFQPKLQCEFVDLFSKGNKRFTNISDSS